MSTFDISKIKVKISIEGLAPGQAARISTGYHPMEIINNETFAVFQMQNVYLSGVSISLLDIGAEIFSIQKDARQAMQRAEQETILLEKLLDIEKGK